MSTINPQELLRFATAGSVDDGKSTLVGRILHDTKSIMVDTLAAVELASRAKGLTTTDLALLTDGLRAEREQGITIDVAYRYFTTAKRSFILADTPGHVQYTRNMVTGASTAELALVLVDARHGLVEQTQRHVAIVALLGVRHLVLAVNKMDLVDHDAQRFAEIEKQFSAIAHSLGVLNAIAIPVSALNGDNVVFRSEKMPWYTGPSLLEHLENVPVGQDASGEPLRFPVQYVIRPRSDQHHDYRAYAGKVAHGVVRVGDEVVIQPAGHTTRILAIDGLSGPLEYAVASQSVALRIADNIDISRGDVISAVNDSSPVVQDITADVCVLADRSLAQGNRVTIQHGTCTVVAKVSEIVARLDVTTLRPIKHTDPLKLNDIGLIRLRLAQPLPVDDYARLRRTGAFLLIDPTDGSTIAAGMSTSRPGTEFSI